MAINPSRGSAGVEAGVHVEVEPFGTTRPGVDGPHDQLASYGEGAFVEFDAPPAMVPTQIGSRNTAIIPTTVTEPLLLEGLNPHFVKVRWHYWEFWRTKPE
jgi:hypothetical protein